MTEELVILSLGAGVQSSTLAKMADHGEVRGEHGEILPKPFCAIFADTGDESAATYAWLDWLEGELSYPVIRASNGMALSKHVYDSIDAGTRVSKPPLFTMALEGEYTVYPTEDEVEGLFDTKKYAQPVQLIRPGTNGILTRDCTGDFKVAVIQRAVRKIMKEQGVKKVTQWIGISLDEAVRMKPSRVKYSTNRWPLIEMRMSRHDCFRWMDAHGYPPPPRSACVYCPHHDNNEWRRIRDEEPESWARAVEFDAKVRTGIHGVRQECFVHRSCVPLPEVDLSTDDSGLKWGNECEGMCGV